MRGGCVISARFLSPVEAGEIGGSSFGRRSLYCSDTTVITYMMMFLRNVAATVLAALIIYGEVLSENSTESYKPEDLLAAIFNLSTSEGRARNRIKFEDDYDTSDSTILETGNFKLGNDNRQYYNRYNDDQRIKFTPDVDPKPGRIHKKRKQRVQKPQGFGLEYQGPYAPIPLQPGSAAPTNYGLWYPGSALRPSKRPKPSLAAEALSSVVEALGSVALHDEARCVARLVCEAAAGGATRALPQLSALDPILTLLSTYSGVSSNPLYVFGRAALLGMSSKDNAASCRYAYPLCPTDPEKLVYYLNNHNGGFFRFFNAPQRGQQNPNQFYDQLSQNHGINQQNFGQYNDYYQQKEVVDYNLENYGSKYPYNQNKYGLLSNIRFENNDELDEKYKIEKRIQNRPEKHLDFEDDLNFDDANHHNNRWIFPENEDYIHIDNFRTGKHLKFPESSYTDYTKFTESKRDPRGFVFPASQTKYSNYNRYQENNPYASTNHNYNNYNHLNSDFYKGYNDNHNGYNKDQYIETVYVVRGNGDPNHPEIITLRPGQSVH